MTLKVISWEDQQKEGRARIQEMESEQWLLDDLVRKNKISLRLREYAEQLSILDFCAWEAEAFASRGQSHEMTASLVDALFASEAVYGIYVMPALQEGTIQIGDSLPAHLLTLRKHAQGVYQQAERRAQFVFTNRGVAA